MNSLRRRIDRFCVLHPNFGIPNLMLYIVIGNIAFYLLSLFSSLNNTSFYSILSFSWAGLKQGQLWRLLSFSFLPTDTRPFWLLVSCYFYYWIGSTLEREWGTAKFTIYYLSGVLLTALGAVAACDAVERTCGVRPQIKWTNDLVLNGKKLSGTLTELSLEGESGTLQYAVIGIGVNCNNASEDFPPELRDVATSLYLETGKRVQRAALAAAHDIISYHALFCEKRQRLFCFVRQHAVPLAVFDVKRAELHGKGLDLNVLIAELRELVEQ